MTEFNPHQILEEYLQANGLNLTQQRVTLLEILIDRQAHVTVDELLRLAQVKHPNLGLSTVYRTVKLFVNAGLATEHHFEDGLSRFEYALEEEHHDHLICKTCGHIFEFENEEIEALQEKIAAEYGLRITSHKLNIYGRCLDAENCMHRAARP